MNKTILLTSMLLGILILFSACTSTSDPAQSVMDYLTSLTAQDADSGSRFE
jgi:hypothetical protein